jgi:dolichol-phosphate mannosyltransferase
MPPQISIIIPLFNEVENVVPLADQVLTAMKGEKLPFEIVLVDDASTDGTWEKIMAENQKDSRVRGLRHGRNSGQSAALWTGYRGSSSPIIVTLDGDLQNDPADIPRLLAGLSEYDVVCGMRVKRQDNWVRKISSKIARAARKSVFGVDFRDTGCGLRAFKRPVLDSLFAFNGFHRFMPVLAHSAGARVVEISVNHRQRTAGKSKYGVWNRMWRGIVDLFGVSWYQKRRIPPVPSTSFPPQEK